jgi:hypothetical protein
VAGTKPPLAEALAEPCTNKVSIGLAKSSIAVHPGIRAIWKIAIVMVILKRNAVREAITNLQPFAKRLKMAEPKEVRSEDMVYPCSKMSVAKVVLAQARTLSQKIQPMRTALPLQNIGSKN